MPHSPGEAPRALVVRLSVPTTGELHVLATDIGRKVAQFLTSTPPAPETLDRAIERAIAQVAQADAADNVTLEFHRGDGTLLIEARCGARSSEVRYPLVA